MPQPPRVRAFDFGARGGLGKSHPALENPARVRISLRFLQFVKPERRSCGHSFFGVADRAANLHRPLSRARHVLQGLRIMATKRHGRAGIFKGASRTPSKRQTPKPSRSTLAPLAGVTYAWELPSDALAWGPDAAETLGLSFDDLPRTGRAFARLIEPGIGPSSPEAIAAGQGAAGAYETRYAPRVGPDPGGMVQDTGRWRSDASGRPA